MTIDINVMSGCLRENSEGSVVDRLGHEYGWSCAFIRQCLDIETPCKTRRLRDPFCFVTADIANNDASRESIILA